MSLRNEKTTLIKRTAAISFVLLLLVQLVMPCIMRASADSDYVVIVTASSVNVRSGAGTGNSQTGVAYLGSVYHYLDEKTDSSGTLWYKIQFSSSKQSWISSKFALKTRQASDYTQAFVNAVSSYYGATGVQVAVIENGVVTDTYSYGWATKNSDPMTDDHKIRVASISKVAVAVNAMKMQEQGIVDIDSNIKNYWGAKPYKAVTLKSLLNHTSTLKSLSYSSTKDGTLSQLKSSDSYNSGTVGSANSWFYNNYAVGIAGSTLEVASGQLLTSYAKTNIFEPLGMDAAFSAGLLNDTSKLTTLYHSNGNVAISLSSSKSSKGRTTPGSNTNIFAGGLTCSAKDLAKMMAMLANDGSYNGVRVLTPASVEAIENKFFTKSEYGGSFSQCMPLRYKAGLYGESGIYYHTGNAYGVLALASYNPETRDGAVVITTGMSDYNTNPACGRDAQGIYEICGKLAEYVYKYHNSSPAPAAPTASTAATTTTQATTTTAPTEPAVRVESITMNEQHIELTLGDTAQLGFTITPSDAAERLEWTSSSKSVSVDERGVITAQGYGTSLITARAGNTSASCTVSVSPNISMNMLGASIRVSAPYGIRFGIQFDKNSFYQNANIVEYGTLIIGAGTLGDADLTLETPSIRKIKADNILTEDSTKLTYTGVLIDIPESFFSTNVTARGYVIYRDADGNECVYYTQTATKNFTGVAQAAYDKYSTIAAPSAAEQEIIERLADIIA